MTEVKIPYAHTSLCETIDNRNLLGIFNPQLPPPVPYPEKEISRAMDHPFDSQPLDVLARHCKNAVIIASDHTRPVPSKYIIPQMLRALRLGNPDIKITILIATGCHRETSREELAAKFGEKIVEQEKNIVHNCDDESMLADLGTLPSGGKLRINRTALETDLLIAEGFIEPHFFAGFSGGRKSVLPGIAARQSVMANHCAEFINSPFARTGILENNPIHTDMIYAAKKAKLAFIVNVVINGEKEIVKAFAGDCSSAHLAGCNFLAENCQISVPPADIVITSNGGYPLDQNVYQSVKGMTAGEAACRPGGVIIIAASCSDGHGGEAFYNTLKNAESPSALLEQISRVGRSDTTPDQWQYQILARILEKFEVILVTEHCSSQMIREMKIDTASSIREAVERAYKKVGYNAKIAVIPDGVSVIVKNINP